MRGGVRNVGCGRRSGSAIEVTEIGTGSVIGNVIENVTGNVIGIIETEIAI